MFSKIKKRVIANKGVVLVITISLLILFIFFSRVITHPNTTYFGWTGDAMQSYYTTWYHCKYDTSYTYFQGMNYPFGEHSAYTNNLPPISFPMMFVSKNIIDISDYTVGVMNYLMLFSVVFSALFIYLIFHHFKLPEFFSAIIAVGIAFLSPQLYRMTAHFTLSLSFAIPALLFLLLIFYKKSRFINSFFIGMLVFIFTLFHAYYFAFFASLLLLFWFIQCVSVKEYRKLKFVIPHLLIQLVIPFLIINFWTYFTDIANDRTAFPWGFFTYISGWKVVFLGNSQFDQFLSSVIASNPAYSYEGLSYIGHIGALFYSYLFSILSFIPIADFQKPFLAIVIFLLGIAFYYYKLKKRKIYWFTENKMLNIFALWAFITLLLSFSWPFNFWPDLVYYIGPLKQARSLGRFAWIFFYVVNILAFYMLLKMKINNILKTIILSIACITLYYDAYSNIVSLPKSIINKIPELADKKNVINYNVWLKSFNSEKYQAIIPLPYFHIGSENYWYSPQYEVNDCVFYLSLKTGLPTTGVMLSRSSISQSLQQLQLFQTPAFLPPIMSKFNKEKPFLVLAGNCTCNINRNELRILNKSKLLMRQPVFSLYELQYDSLASIFNSVYPETMNEIKAKNLYHHNGFLSNDSIKSFLFNETNFSTSNLLNTNSIFYSGDIKNSNFFYNAPLPANKTSDNYVLSFWMNYYDRDIYPRSTIKVELTDVNGNNEMVLWKGVSKYLNGYENGWGFIEVNFRADTTKRSIHLGVWNDEIQSGTLQVKDILLRSVNTNIYKVTDSYLFKNNLHIRKIDD